MAGCRVNHHSGRFVDDEEIGVLVKDAKGDRFRLDFKFLRFRHEDLVGFADGNTKTALGFAPLREGTDVAFCDQFFCETSGQAKLVGKIKIKPHPVMIRLDLNPCLRSFPSGNCIFSIL
jgi:hypothetical protein